MIPRSIRLRVEICQAFPSRCAWSAPFSPDIGGGSFALMPVALRAAKFSAGRVSTCDECV